MPSTVAAIAAAFALSACGNTTHENEPRPPVPLDVMVTVSRDAVNVTPEVIAVRGKYQMNISQNEGAAVSQSNPNSPQAVRITVANLTPVKARLFLQGPVDKEIAITGDGPTSFTAALPTGIYRMSSPISRQNALLAVGRNRNSSATDVLTP